MVYYWVIPPLLVAEKGKGKRGRNEEDTPPEGDHHRGYKPTGIKKVGGDDMLPTTLAVLGCTQKFFKKNLVRHNGSQVS
jgi:hypothetical protein